MRTSGQRFAAHGAPFFAMPSRICVVQGAVDLGGRDDLTIVGALGVVSGHVGTGEDQGVSRKQVGGRRWRLGAARLRVATTASLRNPCS
jgi:hypothetical protein